MIPFDIYRSFWVNRGFDVRQHSYGTGFVSSMPWGCYVSCRALCPDGVVRSVHRIAITADTFFSVPASVAVRVKGKRYIVSGYVTTQETPNKPGQFNSEFPSVVLFHPVNTSKHADTVFPQRHFIELGSFEFAARYRETSSGVAFSTLQRFGVNSNG